MQPFERPVLHLAEVVDRWVEQPSARVEQVLGDARRLPVGRAIDLGAGGLVLDRPFERTVHADGHLTWRAPGRLLTLGPLVRFARVHVEVVEWADGLSEVTVRSRGRRVITWGERRERRFFVRPHRAATRLAETLSTRDVLGPSRGGALVA